MLGPDPISDREIIEKGLVAEVMALARAYRHAPADLYDFSHANLTNKIREMIRREPQPASNVKFPTESFQQVLKVAAAKSSEDEAKSFVRNWMQDMMDVETPEGRLESYYLYVEEQASFAFRMKPEPD